MTEQVSAQKAISAFASSQAEGVWPCIRKEDLVADVVSRLEDSFLVKQAATPLCGPAAVVFELVARQPARYVEICRELHETGGFTGASQRCEPSETLRRSRVRSGTAVADWMLLAAMRDAANAVFDVDAESGDVALGISTPSEMKGWIRELLGFRRAESEATAVYGEFEAMRKADRTRAGGGVAFPLIHAGLLTGQGAAVAYPDHWVSYLGGLSIDEGSWWSRDSGHIRFECYSWGKRYRANADEGTFEDCVWGVVTGEA